MSAHTFASNDAAKTKMTQKQMQAQYEENQKLQCEVATLEKQLRHANRNLVRAKEDLANYEYVKAENEKFLAKLAKEGPMTKPK
jgi:hypothetical protein